MRYHCAKKIELKARWSSLNGQAGTNAHEGSAVHLVGLERNHLESYSKTLNLGLHCQQINCFRLVINQKRQELIWFHPDQAIRVYSNSKETAGAGLESFDASSM